MHADHRPGTDSECGNCRELAYEPGWYAALAAFVKDDLMLVHREPVPLAS
jgi:hypothetical protein